MKREKRSIIMENKLTISQRNAIIGYLFIMPWIIGLFLFTAYPFFYSVFLSMNKVSITPHGIQTAWVGFRNYVEVFKTDVNFPVALTESIVSVVLSTPMIVVTSLVIAILLNGKFWGRSFFRGIFFLPVIIISGPVISQLMTNNAAKIIDPKKYIIYSFFSTLSWFGAPVLYVFDNLVMILWFSGVQILIFLAGIQKIDASIYEAAQIDGASSWEIFWKIVLPYLKPIALVNTIYTIVVVSSFATNKVNEEIAAQMFQTGNVYSYSAAMSWIYFLGLLMIMGIVFLIFRDRSRKG